MHLEQTFTQECTRSSYCSKISIIKIDPFLLMTVEAECAVVPTVVGNGCCQLELVEVSILRRHCVKHLEYTCCIVGICSTC